MYLGLSTTTWVILFFCACVVRYLRQTVGNVKGIAPRAGPRWKMWLAFLLIFAGLRKKMKENALVSASDHEKIVPNPSSDINWNNSFVFAAVNTNQDDAPMLLYARIGLRGNGKSEVTLTIVTDNETYYVEEELDKWSPGETKTISASGLNLSCLEPEKRWRLEFNGKLATNGRGASHIGTHGLANTEGRPLEHKKCYFKLDWTSTTKTYHSGVCMDPWSVARAMSEMPWSRKYFEDLKVENQTRIEQGGTLEGEIIIDSLSTKVQSWKGVRDHSWGRRNYEFTNCFCQSMISFDYPLKLSSSSPSFTHMSWISVDYGSAFRGLAVGWLAGPDVVVPITDATDMEEIGKSGREPLSIKHVVHFKYKGCREMFKMSLVLQGSYNFKHREENYKECDALSLVTLSVVDRKTGKDVVVTEGRGLTALGAKITWK